MEKKRKYTHKNFIKMTPEEFKEKRKERNRQYQLKNKEVLKEKRKLYLKGKGGEKNREYQRNLYRKWRQENPLPERITLTEEEKKERSRENSKRYRQNMTDEQKERRREYYKEYNRNKYKNMTDTTPEPELHSGRSIQGIHIYMKEK